MGMYLTDWRTFNKLGKLFPFVVLFLLGVELTSCGFISDSVQDTRIPSIAPILNFKFLAGHRPSAEDLDSPKDGVGQDARFGWLNAIASSGTHIYVTDGDTRTLRKVEIATGVTTTFAGSPELNGSIDGVGTSASFANPRGLAIDGNYVYVADYDTVRKVSLTTGEVTTLAGLAGAYGSADGTGAAASFSNAAYLTLRGNDLFLTDIWNYELSVNSSTIRKIDKNTGAVSTLAGTPTVIGGNDGTGAAASFYFNAGGQMTNDGTYLYVVDGGNNALRKVHLTTGTTTVPYAVSGNCVHSEKINTYCLDNPGPGATGGIVLDGNVLYRSNSYNGIVGKFDLGSQTFTKIAGSHHAMGSIDGVGGSASFYYPTDLVQVGAHLYVADGQAIRKVNIATGEVTTLAGRVGHRDSPGSQDGIGTAARFKSPYGIAMDSSSIYIADTVNNTIRKISKASGEVNTLAGSPGLGGTADGVGSSARFNLYGGLGGLATDGTNLYIADYFNHSIRKMTLATGVVSTWAGLTGTEGYADGIGTAARFSYPSALVVDGSYLYVADRNQTIRKIALSNANVVTWVGAAGQYAIADGVGTAARLIDPWGMASDGTFLYVSSDAHVVQRIALSNANTEVIVGAAGTAAYTDGIGTSARLNSPSGLTVIGGYLYIGENHEWEGIIRKVNLSTLETSTMTLTHRVDFDPNSAYRSKVQFVNDGTYIFAAETKLNVVTRIQPSTGEVVRSFGKIADPWLSYPLDQTDVAGEGAQLGSVLGGVYHDGDLYFDSEACGIRKVSVATGRVLLVAGDASDNNCAEADGIGENAGFNFPRGMATDGTYLYIADSDHLIRRMHLTTLNVTTIAGTSGTSGDADGLGTAATFNFPWGAGLSVLKGKLYVVDSGNQLLRKVDLETGSVTTIAGGSGLYGSQDGVGSAARFNFSCAGIGDCGASHGITNDGRFLYVADRGNHTIRRIDPETGAVSTFAGISGVSGFADGAGGAARFNFDVRNWNTGGGMSTDGIHLYVPDSGNDAIRKIEIATGEVTTMLGVNTSVSGDLTTNLFDSPTSVIWVSGGFLVTMANSIFSLQ